MKTPYLDSLREELKEWREYDEYDYSHTAPPIESLKSTTNVQKKDYYELRKDANDILEEIVRGDIQEEIW